MSLLYWIPLVYGLATVIYYHFRMYEASDGLPGRELLLIYGMYALVFIPVLNLLLMLAALGSIVMHKATNET